MFLRITALLIEQWGYSAHSKLLNTYTVVPEDSDIVQLFQTGDILGVRRLFSYRKATPFVITQYGQSLLSVAILLLFCS